MAVNPKTSLEASNNLNPGKEFTTFESYKHVMQ